MEVRCPNCNKLLAVENSSGSFEVKRRNMLMAVVNRGWVVCVCGDRVEVRPKDVWKVGG